LRKPEDMPLEQWQIALRKQFGQLQNFRLKNIGDEPIFSEFIVKNPQTQGQYRVAIRGQRIGDNYCSCPDFAVNTLGTCKHIEYTLARLQRKRGGKKAMADGFHPPYSEIYSLPGHGVKLVHYRWEIAAAQAAKLVQGTGHLRPGVKAQNTQSGLGCATTRGISIVNRYLQTCFGQAPGAGRSYYSSANYYNVSPFCHFILLLNFRIRLEIGIVS